MAGFKPRGSIIQFNWQETAEGREFLGGILHRNRRKTFGEKFDRLYDRILDAQWKLRDHQRSKRFFQGVVQATLTSRMLSASKCIQN